MRNLLATSLLIVSLLSLPGCGESSTDGGATAQSSSGATPGGGGGSSMDLDMPMGMPGGGASTDAAMPGGAEPAIAMPGDAGLPGGSPSADAAAAAAGVMPGDPSVTGLAGPPGGGYPGYPNAGALPGDPATTGLAGPPGGYPAGYPGTGTMPGDVPAAGLPGGGLPGGYPDAAAAGYPGGIGPGGGIPGAGYGQQRPTTLDGLANLYFQQGQEQEAMQYLYAWALTSDAGVTDVLANYQWVPGLKRPSLAVRWGVCIHVTTPNDFSGNLYPIGSTQNIIDPRKRREGRGGEAGGEAYGGGGGVPGGDIGGYGMPGAGGGGGDGQGLAKYAGDFGQKILSEFQTRLAGGHFGRVLQEAGSSGGSAGGAPGGYPGGYPGAGAMPGGAGLADAGALPGGPAGYPGMAGAGAAGGVAGPANPTSLTRGMTLIGVVTQKASQKSSKEMNELMAKAKSQEVDVLAIMRVEIAKTKGGFIENEVSVDLYDSAKSVEFDDYKGSAKLSNIKVQQARQADKDDGVDREVKRLFDFVDAKLTMTSLPEAITPEIVKTRRVDALTSATYKNPLPVLAEIRFYHHSKLLSDADTLEAFSKLLGSPDAAKTLLEGSEEDRKKIVEKWLPKG